MNHKQIVALLYAKHNVGPWWQQMVTVTYEQARGLIDDERVIEVGEVPRLRGLLHGILQLDVDREDLRRQVELADDVACGHLAVRRGD